MVHRVCMVVLLALCMLCSLVQANNLLAGNKFIGNHETPLDMEPLTLKSVRSILQSAPTPTPTQDQIYYYVPYDSGRAQPTNKWPANLADVSPWVGYIIYIVLVFLTSWIVLAVTCNIMFYFWCCRCCCKNCGDALPTVQSYNKTERRKLYIPMIIFVAVIAVLTILAVIFVALFAAQVPQTLQSSFGVVDGTFGIVDKLGVVARNSTSSVTQVINNAFTIVDLLYLYLIPLNSLSGAINSTISDLYIIQNDTYNIGNSTAYMARMLGYLSQNGAPGVPDVSGVSTPDITPFVSSVVNTLVGVRGQVGDASNQLRSGVGAAKDALEKNAKPQIQQAINQTTNVFDVVNKAVNEFRPIVNEAKNITSQAVTIANIVISIIICLFVCSAVVVYGLMLLIILPTKGNTAGCLKCASCGTFFFSWIFYLFSGVCIILWAFTTDVCSNSQSTGNNLMRFLQLQINNTIKTNPTFGQFIPFNHQRREFLG
ncbi:hypothetical protein AKO1_010291 [Acrasis kona]|uniref:Prominin-like protein n=1 Tax=Acrasis kona TaxID=1008807 RepID=A0AAW2ZQ49_9EUKA